MMKRCGCRRRWRRKWRKLRPNARARPPRRRRKHWVAWHGAPCLRENSGKHWPSPIARTRSFPTTSRSKLTGAHALMFLGRAEDSKTLYLAHKGKPVSGSDGQLWERTIAEDFAEFRKAGLTHPMMADIEKELGVSP